MNPLKKGIIFAVVFCASVLGLMLNSTAIGAQNTSALDRGPVLEGRVVSTYGPVENARVRLPGTDQYALTDRQGRFRLKVAHQQLGRLRILAGKDGWFNNGQFVQGDAMPVISMNPLYLDDQADYRFISPVTCSRCHTRLAQYWDKSKMAHTTSNTKVLDMYYGTDNLKRRDVAPGYRLDNPGSLGDCAVCHAPSVAASRRGTRDLRQALLSPLTEWDGISCDYCHKVRKVIRDKNQPSGMKAVLERQAPVTGSSILVFGPYDDVAVPPMAASYNSLYDEGRFCATCHGHFKPLGASEPWDWEKVYTAEEWEGFGLKDGALLPIQTTYYEWKQWQQQLPAGDSNKGKKCQDCHLSWRKEMLPYDNYIIDGHARDMWGTRRSPQNIRPHHFDGGTETQLKTSLSLEVEGEVQGANVIIRVYITNTNGGHWVPTGETMRSVMMLLRVADSAGKPLDMINGGRLPDWTGKGSPDQGNYAGQPGAVFARTLHDDAGNLNVPFWKATGIAADTRIRPKTTLTLEYEFALKDPEDEPTAEARLIYRPVIRALAKQKGWPVDDISIASVVW